MSYRADELRFCPRCATALEARQSAPDKAALPTCPACAFVFYLDPKVAAGTLFLYDGGLVLLRRANEPQAGRWAFPGGFVDRGETVQDAAVRETFEECRVRVALTGILDAYGSRGRDVVVVVYAAHVLAGAPAVGEECSEVAVFPPEALPWDELAFESTHAALRDFVRRFFPRVRLPR
jgi:ADP-ribose pyrophosphatase YjhB (NUDIX family)